MAQQMGTKNAARLRMQNACGAAVEAMEGRLMFAAHVAGDPTVYATIQAAVDAAPVGGVVSVDAGSYTGLVTISKSLTIRGAQAGVDARGTRGAETVITTNPTDFYVSANDVTIDGFTLSGTGANIGAGQGAGILLAPNIHGAHILNNIIQGNITGIYLSNNSNTDACVIQHNLVQNNFEAGQNWTVGGWNGSRGIYTDGSVSGGNLTNVLIDSNIFRNTYSGSDTAEAFIALFALNPGEQSNITISNNYLGGNESKAVFAINVVNETIIGNTITSTWDQSSGPVRFEGDANVVNVQYNSIYGNNGPGVAADSSGAPGDSSGFVVNHNNIYSNDGIGVLVIDHVYNGPLIATNGWWGSASGPGGDGPGTGQAVWGNGNSGHYIQPTGSAGGNVTYSPWATSLINISNIPAPVAPTALSARLASAASVQLNWTAQMDTATSQLVQRSTDGVNFTTIAVVPPLLNTFTDNGAASAACYYRVIAANSTGNSTPSNIASTLASAPSALTAVAASQTLVNLNWVDNAAGAETGFVVQRSTDGVNFTQIGTTAAGALGFADAAAQAGTSYTYRVAANSATGLSLFSAAASASTLPASASATTLSNLTWTNATSGYASVQNNYSVLGNVLTLGGKTYSTGLGTHAASTITYALGGKFSNLVTDIGVDDEENGKGIGSVDFQIIGDGRTLFDSGVLHNGAAATHANVSLAGVQTVTLVASPGVSGSIDYDHADWAGATLWALPSAPAAPTGLTAAAVSSTVINLAWTASAGGVSNYIVQRSADGVNFTTLSSAVAASATTYSDAAAMAGVTYSYRVLAVNAAGTSAASNVASALTPSASSISTPLSSLNWASATSGWNTPMKNLSVAGNALTLNGVTYASGIGTHAVSNIVYNLAGAYTNFISDIGVDGEEKGKGGAIDFKVLGDNGAVLYDSGVLTNASATVSINVNVTGVSTLTLVATNGIAGDIDFDHADWAGARLLSSSAQPPAAPTHLAAVTVSATQINLSWTNNAATATGFAIQRSIDGVNFTTIGTAPASASTYFDATAAAGASYTYRVAATTASATSAFSGTAIASTLSASAVVTNVSSLAWVSATSGWNSVQLNKTVSGNALALHGVKYPTGLGTHAVSNIVYTLAGKYSNFIADVGVDDEELGKGVGSVDFQVLGDGKVLFDSGVLTNSSATVSLNINVTNVTTLTLIATNGVAGTIDYDHADWAGARLVAVAPSAAPSAAELQAVAAGSTISAARIVNAAAPSVSVPWANVAIGNVSQIGTASNAGAAFTLSGAGAGVNGSTDALQYVFQPLNGNGSIVAHLDSAQSAGGMAGVMIRESLGANAKVAALLATARGLTFFHRAQTGGAAAGNALSAGPSASPAIAKAHAGKGAHHEKRDAAPKAAAPQWIMMTRSGNHLTAYDSMDGMHWKKAGSANIKMDAHAEIGLAVASGASTLNTALFSDVAVTG